MLLKEIKNIFHLELVTLYPKEEIDSFFYILVEHYLGLERFVLALRPDLVISKENEQPMFEAMTQLKLNRPIQYIIGKTTFMYLEFYVDENVLIPRPETEELVHWILEDCHAELVEAQQEQVKDLKILDIGTGSGCIAISLAKNLPNAEVSALDVSADALEMAKKNAALNEVAVTFIHEDILEDVLLDKKFDLIVSNPPYVREQEKNEMAKNVLEHEPELALFVPDEDSLRFYKSIIAFTKKNLKANGTLYFEINQYLTEETKQLLEANNFQDIELRKDMFGNDRMLKGRIPHSS